jgi:hypothetical protein
LQEAPRRKIEIRSAEKGRAETFTVRDSRIAEAPSTHTQFKAKSSATLAEWQARREALRCQILSAAGLFSPGTADQRARRLPPFFEMISSLPDPGGDRTTQFAFGLAQFD